MTLNNEKSADTIDATYTVLNLGDPILTRANLGRPNTFFPNRSSGQEDNENVLSGDWNLLKGWKPTVVEKLNIFRNLPDNWDGYGGQRLNSRADSNIQRFLRFLDDMAPEHQVLLPEPDIIPGSGGGVQFEWSFNHRELEIEFSESGQIGSLKIDADNSMEESSFNIEELRKVDGLLNWLRGQ
jgi:hypothetical protein